MLFAAPYIAAASSAAPTAAAAAETAAAPSALALYRIGLQAAIPFVGFGFMDNFVMLAAGDYIDTTLGVRLHISTLAAAGIGNLVSDMLGVGMGAWIEAMAEKIGLSPHGLSAAQQRLPSARAAVMGGGMIGVAVGCVLGMAPLLFIDPERAAKLKRKQDEAEMFKSIMAEACQLLNAESGAVWMVDETGETLYRDTAEGGEVRVTSTHGIAGYVARTGVRVSVSDVSKHPIFSHENNDAAATLTDSMKSVLCFPVISSDGSVIAVMQVLNKGTAVADSGRKGGRALSKAGFSKSDEEFMIRLCTHVGVFIEHAKAAETGVDWAETMQMVARETQSRRLIKTASEFDRLPSGGLPPEMGVSFTTEADLRASAPEGEEPAVKAEVPRGEE